MVATFEIAGIALLPILLATGDSILASWPTAGAVAYLAVVPMCLGYVLFGRGLASVSAGTATVLTLAEPAVAALIAMGVLDERLSPVGWAGMGLLAVSMPAASRQRGAGQQRVDVGVLRQQVGEEIELRLPDRGDRHIGGDDETPASGPFGRNGQEVAPIRVVLEKTVPVRAEHSAGDAAFADTVEQGRVPGPHYPAMVDLIATHRNSGRRARYLSQHLPCLEHHVQVQQAQPDNRRPRLDGINDRPP